MTDIKTRLVTEIAVMKRNTCDGYTTMVCELLVETVAKLEADNLRIKELGDIITAQAAEIARLKGSKVTPDDHDDYMRERLRDDKSARWLGAVLFACLAFWAVVIMALTTKPAYSQELRMTYVVEDISGGALIKYRDRANRVPAGWSVQIRHERCLSSCTLWLGHPGAEVHPETIVGFHGPNHMLTAQLTAGVINTMSESQRRYAVNWMAEQYARSGNQALADWFIESEVWRLSGMGFIYMTGQELHDMFGIPLCDCDMLGKSYEVAGR